MCSQSTLESYFFQKTALNIFFYSTLNFSQNSFPFCEIQNSCMICQLYVINVMPVLPSVLQFDLAQFLIQNGLKIFGEDITSLCGESNELWQQQKVCLYLKGWNWYCRETVPQSAWGWGRCSDSAEEHMPRSMTSCAPSIEGWRTGQGGFAMSWDPK